MIDKKTYDLNDDEEYQFQAPEPESNFSTASSAPNDTSTTFFERIKRQHIILGFIFIFLSFGIYKLLNGFFHVISKQHVAVKVQKPEPKLESSVEVKTDTTSSRLEGLVQGQLGIQSALQSLDSQLSSMQTTLASLSSQLTQVNDEIQSLHAAQDTLIQNQTKSVKKIAEKKKEVPKAIYYVRAIIPGRVWLTTQEGATLTLGVGDKLPGYGLVESINPDQGTVTLNSGAVIGYSPDDR